MASALHFTIISLVLQALGLFCYARGYLLYAAVFAALTAWLVSFAEPAEMKCVKDKLQLLGFGVTQMATSKDRKYKKEYDSDILKDCANKTTKTIIFVRHGESDWNEIFNKSKLLLLPRLLKGIVKEIYLLVTNDSLFFDSPLSALGISQARNLRNFLKAEPTEIDNDPNPLLTAAVKTMKDINPSGKSVIVSSNLRRAIATVSIALQDRMKASNERLRILSCLQEVSRNIDTIALAKADTVPDLNGVAGEVDLDFSSCYDTAENFGTKPLSSNGLKRMKKFCKWAFSQKEETIIIGGHSLWFREFFKIFCPDSSTHMAKNTKMMNCACVSFTLESGDVPNKGTIYRVDPSTITPVCNKRYNVAFEGKKGK